MCPVVFWMAGCSLKRKCLVFMLSTVLSSHPPPSEPLLLSLVLTTCGQASPPMLLGGRGQPFGCHFPWGREACESRGCLGLPKQGEERSLLLHRDVCKWEVTALCLPCMLLCCLGRKRVIISFQVSAELQGNMRLPASDQGAT